MYVNFDALNGKVLTKIVQNYDDELLFHTATQIFRMYHSQDCCESVTIEDIVGDLNDLIGSPILMAEEVSQAGSTDDESSTWTFYKLATLKGSVTIRWYGESNGYYSESVDFQLVTE